MKQFCAGLAISFILPFAIPAAHAADIVEMAVEAGTLKSFIAALKTAGLLETLKSSGPYTVFAPSDQAFAKLPKEEWNKLTKNRDKLAGILANHIIPGKILIADVKPGKVKTIQGATIQISSDNGKVTVNDVNVTQSDIIADNGVIHEVDAVILTGQDE
ncbi:MAG TPA: fasciclin domain-containing protein [Burkholderiaceae bacterium]|nr:fasciclin domain-containing protein [Burkholderiaceae bacterium]